MKDVLVVVGALAVVAGVLGGTLGPVAGIAAAHPTPPGGTPTPEPPDRTPSPGAGDMRMTTTENGSVTNGDPGQLPPGCEAVNGTKHVTVRAGTAYAAPGEAFAFDTDRVRAPPCTRLVVTLVNEDAVRHQFMVHGLPGSVYPMGMFAIEVDGHGRVTGSFVTPAEPYRLHTHCSLPQHQQKGMLMEVVVGDGSAGVVGGTGHGHASLQHTHSAGGHSPSSGVGSPGFGPVAAVVGLAAVALLARRRFGT